MRQLILFFLFLLLVGCTQVAPTTTIAPTVTPTKTPEPLVPTKTPVPATSIATSMATIEPTATRTPPTPTVTISADNLPADLTYDIAPLDRFGVGAPAKFIEDALAAGLPFGTYLNWKLNSDPVGQGDALFWQMVRTGEENFPGWDEIEETVIARPGDTWIIGNEPDVIWQDNLTPEQYAEKYHAIYTFIRERDETARIGPGAVTQGTPLRLQYLDRVLAHYSAEYGEPLPSEIWTLHAFTLREEAGSWGVDIPPGIEATEGILYEIEDHDRRDLFAENIVRFRAWMAANGFQDQPLAVTEYGILLPNDYGFPVESIAQFMTDTFDYFLTAADPAIGYPQEDGRLVQYWFWYSLHDAVDYYPTGNLYEPESASLTPLGQTYANYVNAYLERLEQ